jgi:hypothetical protein
VANLGYAGGRSASRSTRRHREHHLRGHRLKENSNGKHRRRLRPLGRRQPGRRDGSRLRPLGHGQQEGQADARTRDRHPDLPGAVAGGPPRALRSAVATTPSWPARRFLWDDYEVGERIDHVDGMTIEEADHMLATRLYQNTAKVHFNEHARAQGRNGRRHRLRRTHHQPGARAVIQRPGQRPVHRRDQRRRARQPDLRRRHRLRVVRGARADRAAGPHRRRRAAPAHRRDQGPARARTSRTRARTASTSRGRPRPRLHGADPAPLTSVSVAPAGAGATGSR